jgi:tetratricopeptide (TPR) repeat protein
MPIHTSVSVLTLLFAASAIAQWDGTHSIGVLSHSGDPHVGAIRGQVNFETPIIGSLTVELVGQMGVNTMSAALQAGGEFELYGVAPGAYQLRVTHSGGSVVHEEPVVVTGGYQQLSIQVRTKSKDGASGGATVSIRQLQHKIPMDAQKEYGKGKAASSKGNQTLALDHFQKAIQLDPEFADAFNDIGVTYAALGQLQQAADQFQKAIDLVPDHPAAAANLSIALCKLEHYHEAGAMARRALKLDPTVLKVRFVLGISLAREGGDQAEALDNLQRAAVEFPNAHLVAAKILAETNRREDAAKQLQDYLSSPQSDDVDRQKVEGWLEELRRE